MTDSPLDDIVEDHDDLFPWTYEPWLESDWHDGLVMGSITSPNGRRHDGSMHTYWQIAAPIWEPHGRLICRAVNAYVKRGWRGWLIRLLVRGTDDR